MPSVQALFDSIPQSGLKSDILFPLIKARFSEEPYVKELQAVFQFNITKDDKIAATWTCDTKSCVKGYIYRSAPKPGVEADLELTIDDKDWVKIMVGRSNQRHTLLKSKFTFRGDIYLLHRLHAFWFDLRYVGRTPELDWLQDFIVNETLIPGLKSEAMAIDIVQRVVLVPHLIETINATIQVNILKGSQLATIYSIDLKPGSKPVFRRGEPPSKPDVTFTIEDDDIVLLTYSIIKVNDAIESGKIKIEGKFEIVERAKSLFEQPLSSPSSSRFRRISNTPPPTSPRGASSFGKRVRLRCDICRWSTVKTSKSSLLMHKKMKHPD